MYIKSIIVKFTHLCNLRLHRGQDTMCIPLGDIADIGKEFWEVNLRQVTSGLKESTRKKYTTVNNYELNHITRLHLPVSFIQTLSPTEEQRYSTESLEVDIFVHFVNVCYDAAQFIPAEFVSKRIKHF